MPEQIEKPILSEAREADLELELLSWLPWYAKLSNSWKLIIHCKKLCQGFTKVGNTYVAFVNVTSEYCTEKMSDISLGLG